MRKDWQDFTRKPSVTKETWYSRDWGLFAYSFKKSADLVYQEYRKARREAFWFPALYLYRQWMELCLKSLWSDIRRFDKSMPKIPLAHKLSPLWLQLKPWLQRERLIREDDGLALAAERVFSIFDQIDPAGTAYRYPPLHLPHPDLVNFSLDDFDKAIDEIDTVFFALFNLMGEYEEFRISVYRGTPP